MEFEYNTNKSAANKKKHRVTFEEAEVLWAGDNVILLAITKGEQRYMIIGKIGPNLYSCIFTTRREKIRIISCRRTRDKERRIYHEKIKERNNI
ncbi:hypothetical protein B9J78_06645 [bacterium Unc6]|nr:hypothetical protein [bacterium Unc6]